MGRSFRSTIFGILCALLSVSLVIAQDECTGLISDALLAVDDNCEGLERNNACYGFDQVEAQFITETEDDFFSVPSDRVALEDIALLRTAPLDQANNVWGVAVMNAQADLPNTLPGQNVTMMLFGDVEVENAVDPETAFSSGEPIEITVAVAAGANIRSGPGTNYNVVGGARPDEVLETDAVSEDREWFRIAYRDRPAWVSASVMSFDEAEYGELVAITPELRTPMQAFYLRTGVGQAACDGVPGDSLFIQGPDNIEITLTVNGADVQIGSSGVLKIVEIDGQFYIENTVFDGTFQWGNVLVRRGYRTRLCLDDDQRDVTCDASTPELIPIEEYDALWCQLEGLPPGLLNYRLDVPCSDDPVVTPGGGNTGSGGSDSQITEVDCSNFSIPPVNVIATNFTIDWNDVPGATGYVIGVFDGSGVEVQTYIVSESFLGTNGGSWPSSGYFDVRAYRDGEYACYARQGFSRAGDPNLPPPPAPVPGAGFSASVISCTPGVSSDYDATISWVDAPTGTVTVFFTDSGIGAQSAGGSGVNGSLTINGYWAITGISIQSGTQSIGLGNCP